MSELKVNGIPIMEWFEGQLTELEGIRVQFEEDVKDTYKRLAEIMKEDD